ncbi:MAG: sodium:calcium antiporter, partial [Minisyncoccales bacterium]
MPFFIFFLPPALFLFYWGNQRLIKSITRLSYFFSVKEFTLSFLFLGFISTLPNFLTGLYSAFHNIPLLSLGDILGGNVIDLTLGVALAVFFTKGKMIKTEGKQLNQSLIFALFCALLPLLLISDGAISKRDGLLLLFVFFIYLFWLLFKKEKSQIIFSDLENTSFFQKIKIFFHEIFLLLFLIVLLFLCVQVIVSSVVFFSEKIGLTFFFGGIAILALINCLPEIYFAVLSARQGKAEMVLGDLLSAVVGPATFVLGTVAFLNPFSLQ